MRNLLAKLPRYLRARWRRAPSRPQILGATRLEGDLWRAQGRDPQAVFPGPRAPLTLFARTRRPAGLTPRLYFDWGRGFRQADSAPLPGGARLLFVFDPAGCPDLRALRFDPFEGEGDFELTFGPDAALAPGDVAPTPVALRDYAPARRGRAAGRLRGPASPAQHFARVCALAQSELAGHFASPPQSPLISLVCPLYDTPPAYLDDLLASFARQIPGYAELILSDDGSTSPRTQRWLRAQAGAPGLVILRHGVNRGIAAATNAGVAAARGAFVGFIDHDDALSPHAIAVLARALQQNARAKFLYTDELIADRKLRALDFFDKPAFDDVLLSGVNYINHLSLYRRDLLASVGALREGFDGSQDYDLLLRALKTLAPDEIAHVPYPAYIWRRDGRSYSVTFLDKATANARRALGERYAPAPVAPAHAPDLHRVRFDLVAARPKISVIVPNRDAPALMREVADGLFSRTDYADFELIVVDNGSTDPQTLALYAELGERPNFRLLMQTAPFNFSRQINQGVAAASGQALLLLNNDIEIREPGWLAEMAGCLSYPRAGIVGARLLYPDGTLQHAGVVVGLDGLAGHWYLGRDPADHGPMGRLAVRATLSAVTGACMLISRACWQATGPFDEAAFPIAYNDVDFCLRARAAGFRTLYTPFATLTHHESATRGSDEEGANRVRFLRDQAALSERHGTRDFLDHVLSPWHSRDQSEPQRVPRDRLPPARFNIS